MAAAGPGADAGGKAFAGVHPCFLSDQCSICNVIFPAGRGGARAGNARPGHVKVAVSAVFLIGYGAVCFVAEFFREPDAGIFGLSYTVSMGQWLSLPMIAVGVAMLAWSNKAASR